MEAEQAEQVTDLRRAILHEIREVKRKLLSQTEDELKGIQGLTVMQNAALTTELEYQSKKTEDFLQANRERQLEIQMLQRELRDCESTEVELARRSQFCQQAIKKYRSRIASLKDELQQAKERASFVDPKTIQDQELSNYLQSSISTYEDKLRALKSRIEEQQEDHRKLQARVNETRTGYSKLCFLLTDFIEGQTQTKPDLLTNQ